MSTLRSVAEDGRKVAVLTRDDIITALREYARLYGADFPQSAFSPSQAKRNGRPELVERYYSPRPSGGRWPSLNAVKDKFGSWNAARAAAGFAPNSTGPASGRRPSGTAEPILNVRERLVYVPSEKTRKLAERVRRLEERLARAQARAERAEVAVAEMRARRAPVREVVTREPGRTVVKTKTVTKRVVDKRAVERAKARLADEQAAHRATLEQLRSERRDHDRLKGRFQAAEADAISARQELASADRDLDHARDRLVASVALIERLRGEIAEAREQLLGASEAAAASELVQHAERRADDAEVRAARAEREMAEQAAAVTGELRKLTPAELDELRKRGPAGPSVLAKALQNLARARLAGGRERQRAALTEVASAALMFRDRLP